MAHCGAVECSEAQRGACHDVMKCRIELFIFVRCYVMHDIVLVFELALYESVVCVCLGVDVCVVIAVTHPRTAGAYNKHSPPFFMSVVLAITHSLQAYPH
jgi:hypothetical protein